MTPENNIVLGAQDIEIVARMLCGGDCPLADNGGCPCPEWGSYVEQAEGRLRFAAAVGSSSAGRDDLLAEYASIVAKGGPLDATEWKRVADLRKMLGLDEA